MHKRSHVTRRLRGWAPPKPISSSATTAGRSNSYCSRSRTPDSRTLCSNSTAIRLRQMTDHHAESEIALNLRVTAGGAELFDAPDVGDNILFVSERTDAVVVETLRAAL